MRKSRIARSQPPRSPPKRVGRGSRHTGITLDKRALRVSLSATQLTDLKKLAGPDFEPAGNYVYRWKWREIEKIALSAHVHSFAVKTTFLPVLLFMRGIRGRRKRAWIKALDLANIVLAPFGNLLISIIFKRPPTGDQVRYLQEHSYSFSVLEHRYPAA